MEAEELKEMTTEELLEQIAELKVENETSVALLEEAELAAVVAFNVVQESVEQKDSKIAELNDRINTIHRAAHAGGVKLEDNPDFDVCKVLSDIKAKDTQITDLETILAGMCKQWYCDGKLHREDGPAIEWANGTREWFIEGKRHREDGPAVEWINGTNEWYLDGKRHRKDGPAIDFGDGRSEWWTHGQRDRVEG